MYTTKSTRSESSINVTPLADVSLSLLLGFMVITPIIFQTLSATLPQGAGAASGQVKPDPIVEYTADRRILLDSKEVTMEELLRRIEELHRPGSGAKRKVMFTGAGELPYDEIITFLDQLREHGVETIGIR